MELPADLVGGMVLGELVLHGWDLARATGLHPHWDDPLALRVYEEIARSADMGRQMGVYAAEVRPGIRAAPGKGTRPQRPRPHLDPLTRADRPERAGPEPDRPSRTDPAGRPSRTDRCQPDRPSRTGPGRTRPQGRPTRTGRAGRATGRSEALPGTPALRRSVRRWPTPTGRPTGTPSSTATRTLTERPRRRRRRTRTRWPVPTSTAGWRSVGSSAGGWSGGSAERSSPRVGAAPGPGWW